LGISETPDRSLKETLLTHLKSRRLLLVLDNCEHLLSACAPLAEELLHGCAVLWILTTSRQSLSLHGESAYQVPSMLLPDPPAQIAARLDDRFRLLTGGSRTALPRQQTLKATLDWSYDLLTPREQSLLQRLSVFAGGWTLEAAEQVTGDRLQGKGERQEETD